MKNLNVIKKRYVEMELCFDDFILYEGIVLLCFKIVLGKNYFIRSYLE